MTKHQERKEVYLHPSLVEIILERHHIEGRLHRVFMHTSALGAKAVRGIKYLAYRIGGCNVTYGTARDLEYKTNGKDFGEKRQA